MKHLRIFTFIVLSSVVSLLASCASGRKAGGSGSKNSGPSLSEQDRIKAVYAFFDGQKEKMSGNDQNAADHFAQCLRIDPGNHAAMYELANIYSSRGKLTDALFLIRKAATADPQNEWYQLLLADVYERSGNYGEAISIYRELYRRYPGRVEYLFSESEVLLMQGKLTEAIRTYDQIEKVMGINPEITQQKQRLFLKMGKVTEAAAELEKLIASDPNHIEYYSLLVELWQVNNQPEKAAQVILRMQVIQPESPQVYLALAEQYRMEGKPRESFEQLKKAFNSPLLGSEVKLQVLMSYLPLVESNPEMMTQALELSQTLSRVHPNEAIAQTVYGDFLSIDKQYAPARERYRAGLAIDKKNIQAWQQMLLVESELKDYISMQQEGEEALGLFPDQSVLYLLTGIASMQNKDYEGAASKLLSGSKLVVDNDEQLMEFYSNLGDVYNKLRKFEESDKYYQKALNIDKNSVYVLNNWAYYLSLRKEQLEKAAEMSKRSNEINPGNPSFEDTYAWILYIQGNYNEALIWIEKAQASGGGENGTLLEHYGDILYRLGRREDAVRNWERAKATGEYSNLLEKKLSEKKLYE